MPKAASLAEEVKSEFDVDAQLIPSMGGCFEVVADGKLLFSKKQEGRFPRNSEILEMLRADRQSAD